MLGNLADVLKINQTSHLKVVESSVATNRESLKRGLDKYIFLGFGLKSGALVKGAPLLVDRESKQVILFDPSSTGSLNYLKLESVIFINLENIDLIREELSGGELLPLLSEESKVSKLEYKRKVKNFENKFLNDYSLKILKIEDTLLEGSILDSEFKRANVVNLLNTLENLITEMYQEPISKKALLKESEILFNFKSESKVSVLYDGHLIICFDSSSVIKSNLKDQLKDLIESQL